jgi:sialate O-acetylesterase
MKRDLAEYRKALIPLMDSLDHWAEQAERALAEGGTVPSMPPCPAHPLNSHEKPTGLYNGMVHPLVPFALRGALWYQGEQNIGEGLLYFDKMKALIQGWRAIWNLGEFPFYFVQLAPFSYYPDSTGEDSRVYALPEIREAQLKSLSIPHTGMVVTTDIGDLNDIHPRNKQDVGKRLALWALSQTYGRADLVYSGPLYRSMEREGERLRLRFDHVGGGLASRDGKPLTGFEMAGVDGRYLPAKAHIEDDTVVVFSETVKKPRALRFGWHQDAQPNLINQEGLPASPFSAALGEEPLRD